MSGLVPGYAYKMKNYYDPFSSKPWNPKAVSTDAESDEEDEREEQMEENTIESTNHDKENKSIDQPAGVASGNIPSYAYKMSHYFDPFSSKPWNPKGFLDLESGEAYEVKMETVENAKDSTKNQSKFTEEKSKDLNPGVASGCAYKMSHYFDPFSSKPWNPKSGTDPQSDEGYESEEQRVVNAKDTTSYNSLIKEEKSKKKQPPGISANVPGYAYRMSNYFDPFSSEPWNPKSVSTDSRSVEAFESNEPGAEPRRLSLNYGE